ncbi:MerR family transcriptional regulator [Aeromicrobium sp. CF4.19]|uniref:MerR family transcriptional regulator n=1 Tax=Aeromicrobium sp. CF4.19 TaxID=3373082 RepID=UPI003EE69011
MAWSTRELAELAGTTLRAVRHYHEVGLLEVPERRVNGYKTYGVPHLLRLLWIRSLVDLGFSLSEIADLPEDPEHSTEELRRLDAELAASIERLERTRARLAEVLDEPSRGIDHDERLFPLADHDLTDADRHFQTILARVVSPEVLQTYAERVLAMQDDPVLAELDALPVDADEAARAALAERLTPSMRLTREQDPLLQDPTTGSPVGRSAATRALDLATEHLYNRAQVDVVARAIMLAGPPRREAR